MAHEEQNDPVAQSSMYQRRPPNLVASTADLSERDIKENPVVKEEETNDTEFFEEVVVEVARTQGYRRNPNHRYRRRLSVFSLAVLVALI